MFEKYSTAAAAAAKKVKSQKPGVRKNRERK